MFAARLHDPTLPTFTRQEAAELIPKSNPFLRKLFQYVAGYDLDHRVVWIVDALADIFRATDVKALLTNFGSATQQNDPIIHFYETFLAQYDPALRKARGVWYTPEPVVKFIVRAVDDILKSEFGLKDGLADTSKTKIKRRVVSKATADQRSKLKEIEVEQEIHRVQILDPATGTFLAEVIKHIYSSKFAGQQGIWRNYIETHLMPRLNGFELLMASYAMAHLKLDLLLSETGYKTTKDQRLKVYLTNSLEEHHQDTGTLFANWLSTEANEANHIKRNVPVMVIVGNPPYSVSSSNKSEWIEKLVADYKRDLNEKNIQPLSDDYIKFIRFGEHFINKTRHGILAYISNNSFIDGIIHRQMRKHLLQSFDKIYVLDLYGSTKKLEVSPDGTKDENVFDIMQGVSINLFIKTGRKAEESLSEIYSHNLYGRRSYKYNYLEENTVKSIPWQKLQPKANEYYFLNKNDLVEEQYLSGFKLDELFKITSNGIKTHRDHFVVSNDANELKTRISTFFDHTTNDTHIRNLFELKDNRDWKLTEARNGKFQESFIQAYLYRPFDTRYIYYDQDLIDFGRFNVVKHMLGKENLAFVSVVQAQAANLNYFDCIFITDKIADTNMYRRGGPNLFPLYLYNQTDNSNGLLLADSERVPNLNQDILAKISASLSLHFDSKKKEKSVYSNLKNSTVDFGPEDLFDYIYALLHSPSYREKYQDFLKAGFPRVPYPTSSDSFYQLAGVGAELRQLHLLESTVVSNYITQYPVDGNNTVSQIRYDQTNVYINDTQYFGNVPTVAWEFYIGGYQPVQKWLKDRKEQQLSFDEILHYQKMIVALVETDRLMKEIDENIKL